MGRTSGKIIFIPLEPQKNSHCASWEQYTKEDDSEMCIELDPGMAFGTGDHPTSMCLKAIETYVDSDNSVIDVEQVLVY